MIPEIGVKVGCDLTPCLTFTAGYTLLYWGSVARMLGCLSATLGQTERAIAQLEAALVRDESIGAAPWLAHTSADLALTLARRGRSADRDRVCELARRGLRIAVRLGAERVSRRARAALDLVGAAP